MKRLFIIFSLLIIIINAPCLAGVQAPRKLVGAGGGSSTFEIRAFDTGTGASSAECSMSVNSGEKLVVSGAAEQLSGDMTISSSPSLTWTTAVTQTGSGGRAIIFTSEATATGTITVTTTASSSSGSSCVLYAITSSESTMGGATAHSTNADMPSVAITTTRADSLIIAVSGDFNAAAGDAVYRTPPTHTPRLEHQVSGAYGGYHYTASATTVASYTMGMTAPTGQASGTAVLEVRKPE